MEVAKMHHLIDMFKFLFHARRAIGDDAPAILQRAIKASHMDVFSTSMLPWIMYGDMELVEEFCEFRKNPEMVLRAFEKKDLAKTVISLKAILYILFGDQMLKELAFFLESINLTEDLFNETLCEKLAERGILWEVRISLHRPDIKGLAGSLRDTKE